MVRSKIFLANILRHRVLVNYKEALTSITNLFADFFHYICFLIVIKRPIKQWLTLVVQIDARKHEKWNFTLT